jgi:FkbM family methyltransferase
MAVLKFLLRPLISFLLSRFPILSVSLIRSLPIGDKRRGVLEGLLVRLNAGRLQRLLGAIGYPNELRIDRSGIAAKGADLVLDAGLVDRYFLARGAEPTETEGRRLAALLAERGISVRRFIDIGANFGEYSIWFSRYGGAEVLAVEPSPENIAVFEHNLALNGGPAPTLRLLPRAIADAAGDVRFGRGRSQQNSLVTVGEEFDVVEAITLDACLAIAGFDPVDLIKIDIEGAEPLLTDSLARNARRIRALLIEMGGGFATPEGYLGIVDVLLAAGFRLALFPTGAALDRAGAEHLIRTSHIDILFWRPEAAAEGAAP